MGQTPAPQPAETVEGTHARSPSHARGIALGGQQLAHELIAREEAPEPVLAHAHREGHAAIRQHAQRRLRNRGAVPGIDQIGAPLQGRTSRSHGAASCERSAQGTAGVRAQQAQLAPHMRLVFELPTPLIACQHEHIVLLTQPFDDPGALDLIAAERHRGIEGGGDEDAHQLDGTRPDADLSGACLRLMSRRQRVEECPDGQ